MEDYGNVGLSWQKDASWGSYHVTTLHAYEPVILENALIYSDNIYFAKAALKIGSEEMESSLTGLGFNEELPFEIKMAESQYSNSERGVLNPNHQKSRAHRLKMAALRYCQSYLYSLLAYRPQCCNK